MTCMVPMRTWSCSVRVRFAASGVTWLRHRCVGHGTYRGRCERLVVMAGVASRVMLPHAYELPAAIVLVLGGALACFAGYRLFRIVLGIYGFILGAMIASSVMGVTNTARWSIAAVVGGLVGARRAGVRVFRRRRAGRRRSRCAGRAPRLDAGRHRRSAGAGADCRVDCRRDRRDAAAALRDHRRHGVRRRVDGRRRRRASAGGARRDAGRVPSEVWILYPTSFGDQRWAPIAWIVLGLVGTACSWRSDRAGRSSGTGDRRSGRIGNCRSASLAI